MIDVKYSEIGTELTVIIEDKKMSCKVVEKPFYDPEKKIASS